MNKTVFLSICLFSFNAAWTSSPAAASSSSAAAASSTLQSGKEMTILLTCKTKTTPTTFLVRDGSNTGVAGTANTISGPQWTTNGTEIPDGAKRVGRTRYNTLGQLEYCFDLPPRDVIFYESVMHQGNKISLSPNQQPDPIMQGAITRLHQCLKLKMVYDYREMPNMSRTEKFPDFLGENNRSLWTAHYDHMIGRLSTNTMGEMSPYTFNLAKSIIVSVDVHDDVMETAKKLSPHCQDLELDIASSGDTAQK